MQPSDVALPLRIGARTLWSARRRLVRHRVTLESALAKDRVSLPFLPSEADGYYLSGWPLGWLNGVVAEYPALLAFERQHYDRHFARLDLGFDRWLAGLSSKSRSTLKRKVRRLTERSGGKLDLRGYRTPEEMEVFHGLARPLSARTYQEKLLGSGLPSGPEAVEKMKRLARQDRIRGWLLFLEGRPIAYLHAPAEGSTLLYAHLGYDPDHSGWSPGTVLQYEVMRRVMEEKSFDLFDFTEGDGQHKRIFSTDRVPSIDLLLLRPGLKNRLLGHGLASFDHMVGALKSVAVRTGAERRLRGLRR